MVIAGWERMWNLEQFGANFTASVATPFVLVNAVSTNLRENNSPLNTFFAGAASGLVLGAASEYL